VLPDAGRTGKLRLLADEIPARVQVWSAVKRASDLLPFGWAEIFFPYTVLRALPLNVLTAGTTDTRAG